MSNKAWQSSFYFWNGPLAHYSAFTLEIQFLPSQEDYLMNAVLVKL